MIFFAYSKHLHFLTTPNRLSTEFVSKIQKLPFFLDFKARLLFPASRFEQFLIEESPMERALLACNLQAVS